jgi:hypothetical protein
MVITDYTSVLSYQRFESESTMRKVPFEVKIFNSKVVIYLSSDGILESNHEQEEVFFFRTSFYETDFEYTDDVQRKLSIDDLSLVGEVLYFEASQKTCSKEEKDFVVLC